MPTPTPHPETPAASPPSIEFLCPACRRRNLSGLEPGEWRFTCRHCSHPVKLQRGKGEEPAGPVGACAVCGGGWFYLQKDFNQKIGCGVVLLGILFSFHTYGLSLVVCALVDLALYRWLPWVTVCYYCQAHYRGVRANPAHRVHDLQIAETTARERERGLVTLRNQPETVDAPADRPPA